MLVALLILGIMSALGYGTYRAARISAERTEESLKRSREIEFGMRMLVMDFAQMVPRPVRDPLGQIRLPALHGYAGNGTSAAWHASVGGGGALGADFQACNSDSTGPGFQSTLQRLEHHQPAAGRTDARRLVEHRRPAAQHLAAGVLRAGGRCAEAQLHHGARHRAGHPTRGSGSVQPA